MTAETGSQRSRLGLYIPFVIGAVLVAIYSAYWFWMRGQLAAGIDQWIAEQRAAGIEINYASKTVDGFPYRFALQVEAPEISNPHADISWRGEKLQLVMQPWNFQHVIGRAPGRNALSLPGGEPVTAFIGDRSAASLSWRGETIRRFALSLDEADIVLATGSYGVRDFSVNYAPPAADAEDPRHRVALDLGGATLPAAPIEAPWLGEEIDAVRLRLELENPEIVFGARILDPSRYALPDPAFDLAQLLVNWGPVKLGAKGKVSFRLPDCAPDGVVNFRLEEIEALRGQLEAANLLTEEVAAGLSAIGFASNDGGFAPITLRAGTVTFMGQPAGPALPALCPQTLGQQ
ncbi:MAG: DUF2125 domain-containing protein [Pseudomonadota bacterium]